MKTSPYTVSRSTDGTWIVVHGRIWIMDCRTRAQARQQALRLNQGQDRANQDTWAARNRQEANDGHHWLSDPDLSHRISREDHSQK